MTVAIAGAMLIIAVLVAWRGSWIFKMISAAVLFASQVVFVLQISAMGRPVMEEVIRSGGPVREVSEALMKYRDLAIPSAMAIVLAGCGLFVLVALGQGKTR